MIKVPLTSIKVGYKFKLTDSPTAPVWKKGQSYDKNNTIIFKGKSELEGSRVIDKWHMVYPIDSSQENIQSQFSKQSQPIADACVHRIDVNTTEVELAQISDELWQKMQETSIIDITKAIDRVCAVVDDEDKLELILNEYKSTYNLSKKEFLDYFPFTRQDTKNALYFFLLTQFHKIVKLALKNKTSLLPFHEVLTIYMRQFASALEKFDETRGFSFWSYAKWYEYAANSEIKRICEKQSIVSPIENE